MEKINDLFIKQKKRKVTSEQFGKAFWLLSGELTSEASETVANFYNNYEIIDEEA